MAAFDRSVSKSSSSPINSSPINGTYCASVQFKPDVLEADVVFLSQHSLKAHPRDWRLTARPHIAEALAATSLEEFVDAWSLHVQRHADGSVMSLVGYDEMIEPSMLWGLLAQFLVPGSWMVTAVDAHTVVYVVASDNHAIVSWNPPALFARQLADAALSGDVSCVISRIETEVAGSSPLLRPASCGSSDSSLNPLRSSEAFSEALPQDASSPNTISPDMLP